MGLGAAALPVVFVVAGAGQAAADPGVCVSGPWGMHLHASTGPDGSIGARTGTVGGATVGKTVTTKVRTASASCQWPVSSLMRLHEAVTAQAGCNTCDNAAVPWTGDGI